MTYILKHSVDTLQPLESKVVALLQVRYMNPHMGVECMDQFGMKSWLQLWQVEADEILTLVERLRMVGVVI